MKETEEKRTQSPSNYTEFGDEHGDNWWFECDMLTDLISDIIGMCSREFFVEIKKEQPDKKKIKYLKTLREEARKDWHVFTTEMLMKGKYYYSPIMRKYWEDVKLQTLKN